MIEHVVLFKLTDDATADVKAEIIRTAGVLKDEVDGVLDVTIGENFSDRNQGYDIGLVVRFRDRESLERYLPHPAHRGWVDRYIAPFKAGVIVVGYEIAR